jgi:HEAT repeat protein
MSKKMKLILGITATLGICIAVGLIVYSIPQERLDPNTLALRQNLRQAVSDAKKGKRDIIGLLINNLERKEGKIVSEKLLPEYESFLKDSDAQVQLLGVCGIGALSKPSSKKPLIKYLESVDAGIFKQKPVDDKSPDFEKIAQKFLWTLQAVGISAATLGTIGDESAIPALEKFKDFPGFESSNPVTETLSKLGSVKSFTGVSQDADFRKIASASSGIQNIRDPKKVPELMGIIRESKNADAVRIAAIEALCAISSSDSSLFVFSIAKDISYPINIRSMAAFFLGNIHSTEVEKQLMELADDSDIDVKAYALTGLVLYKPEQYFSRWFDTLMDKNESPTLRTKLSGSIIYIPDNLLMNQREHLYRCLDATDENGSPHDQIRTLAWERINRIFQEQPSIVLSNKSSPYISDIKGSIMTRLLGSGAFTYNTPLQEKDKKVNEILQTIVSFSDQSSEVQK